MTARRKADPRVERWKRTVLNLLSTDTGRVAFGTEDAIARRIVRAIDRASRVARRKERKRAAADAVYVMVGHGHVSIGPMCNDVRSAILSPEPKGGKRERGTR